MRLSRLYIPEQKLEDFTYAYLSLYEIIMYILRIYVFFNLSTLLLELELFAYVKFYILHDQAILPILYVLYKTPNGRTLACLKKKSSFTLPQPARQPDVRLRINIFSDGLSCTSLTRL